MKFESFENKDVDIGFAIKYRILFDCDFDMVFDLVKSCYTKDFYEITDSSKSIYKKAINSGYSIGAFYDNKLVGIMLGMYASDNHFSSLVGDIPEEFNNLDMNNCFELMSSCVHKDYRGYHMEQQMIKHILDNIHASFFWCTAHKDNISSNKSILANGFKLVKKDCTFQYSHKTIYHRNLYYLVQQN